MQDSPPTLASFIELFARMPPVQAALVIAFFVFSIVAGNAVFVMHYRRVGRPVLKSLFSPLSFPLKDFNRREWLLLAMAFVLSMAIAVAAAHAG